MVLEANSPATTAMETPVWTGRGFSPREGTLRLADGRLRFTLDGQIVFDAPIGELAIRWPWYGFGCQFWASVGTERHFISFLHTSNTLGSWARGVQHGRTWRRAIEACRG